jgi:hypothetical protein
MVTNKPKIQGYVDEDVFAAFEAKQQEWGMSQSQALNQALSEWLGYKRLPEAKEGWQEQLATLRAEFAQLQHQVKGLGLIVVSEHRLSTGEYPQLASELLGDPPQINSDSPSIQGDPPQINSDSPADIDISRRDISTQKIPAQERYIVGLLHGDNGRTTVHGYWKDFKSGFVPEQEQAKTYDSVTNAKRAIAQISKRLQLEDGDRVMCKVIR